MAKIKLFNDNFQSQPYSLTGERQGEADDRALWPYMFNRIREIRPRWVVGENVAGHVSLGLDDVLSNLESEGYTAQTFIIPAAGVGAYHYRERVFVVANSTSKRLQGGQIKASGRKSWQEAYKQLPRFLSPNIRVETPNPIIYRDSNGIPDRLDRNKSLGNAVVPQQIYPIFAAIAAIESA